MEYKVCDTNVLIVANGLNTHANIKCQISCVDALMDLKNRDILILDHTGEILNEYSRYSSHSGQPGVGDAFFKHIFDNIYNQNSCLLVTITKIENNTYAEVPGEINDAGFDKSDQKFVAAAISSGKTPFVLNATDSDWHIHKEQLDRNGINVSQLCPQHQDKNE